MGRDDLMKMDLLSVAIAIAMLPTHRSVEPTIDPPWRLPEFWVRAAAMESV